MPCLVATDLPSDSVARLVDLPSHTQIFKCYNQTLYSYTPDIHKKLFSLLRKMFHVRDVHCVSHTYHCSLFRSCECSFVAKYILLRYKTREIVFGIFLFSRVAHFIERSKRIMDFTEPQCALLREPANVELKYIRAQILMAIGQNI